MHLWSQSMLKFCACFYRVVYLAERSRTVGSGTFQGSSTRFACSESFSLLACHEQAQCVEWRVGLATDRQGGIALRFTSLFRSITSEKKVRLSLSLGSIAAPNPMGSHNLPSCQSTRSTKVDTADWRRGWDSNPRDPCGPAGFQDRYHRPLGHPSGRTNYTTLLRAVFHLCLQNNLCL